MAKVSSLVVPILALLSIPACCVSRQNAEARSRELREQSRERSIDTMRAAASRLGATLLGAEVQTFRQPWDCMSETLPERERIHCEPWWFGQLRRSGPLARAEDPRGQRRIVVPVHNQDRDYARLARRGDTLFLLRPRVVRVKVGEGTACECDSGYGVHVVTHHAFVIDDDSGIRNLQTLTVDVTQDYIDWDCKAVLAEAEGAGAPGTHES